MQMYKHVSTNNIKLSSVPFLRELTMEAYLIENPSVLSLDNDDFLDPDIIDCELSLKNGRDSKNHDGRIDLLALYSQNTLGIIELKIGELNETHLLQLEDYFKKKNQIIECHKDVIEKDESSEAKWVGILVGSSINDKLKQKINNGYLIENTYPLAALIINRFRSEDNQLFVFTETYFRNVSRNFDRTKYKFENRVYGKGRLVLAIIKKYVENNPEVLISELKYIFPLTLHGRREVFEPLIDAQNIYDTSGRKRHFLNQEDIICLNENIKIVVTSQWGIGNIENMIKKAKDLGFAIEEIKS